jgi:cysteinyl-tRNA synthetase
VYFDVHSWPAYGELTRQGLDDVEPADDADPRAKRDPRDFALWKGTKPGEPATASWDTPWGPGRPGWHLECSAMATRYLGTEFDLHGGGIDLRFPHHENELAQSRGAGRAFARIWMHNGMLRLAEEKMSKSAGNIISLREALDRWGRDAILIFFLGAHYRSPVDFSEAAMEAAGAQAASFRTAFRVVSERRAVPPWSDFAAALDDDFNTPAALALLHEWRAAGQLDLLHRGASVFGLEVQSHVDGVPEEVRRLAEERQAARLRRDFVEADRIRAEIEHEGWEVQDVPDGFRLVPKI